jgi:hypothetical protein
MNFKTFKERMVVIHDMLDSQDRVADFIHAELAPDDHKPCVTFGWPMVKAYIEMLKEAVGDDGDWIEYWLWECDRGRRKTGGWTHKKLNDKMQPMRTLKDLWQAIHYRATI